MAHKQPWWPTEILARQHAQTLNHFWICRNPLRDVDRTRQIKTRAKILEDIASAAKSSSEHTLWFPRAIEFFRSGISRDWWTAPLGPSTPAALQQRRRRCLGHDGNTNPRTLALTAYGDMEVSRIMGKTPGRKPVDTRLCPKTMSKIWWAVWANRSNTAYKFTGFAPCFENQKFLTSLPPKNAILF